MFSGKRETEETLTKSRLRLDFQIFSEDKNKADQCTRYGQIQRCATLTDSLISGHKTEKSLLRCYFCSKVLNQKREGQVGVRGEMEYTGRYQGSLYSLQSRETSIIPLTARELFLFFSYIILIYVLPKKNTNI